MVKEIEGQVDAVPSPRVINAGPKSEFEKQSEYQNRVKKNTELNKRRRIQYENEVASIRGGLEAEVQARTKGYKEALNVLNRKFELTETDFRLLLGKYDPESEMFPEVSLQPKISSSLDGLSWPLIIKPKQAQQLKKTVENDAVRIRANVNLDANLRQSKIENVLIEDVVQGKTFGYPLNPGYRKSVLWRSALIPGSGQFYANKRTHGLVFLSSALIAGVITFSRYNKLYDGGEDYELAFTEEEFNNYYQKLNLSKTKKRQYHLALASLGSVWSVNLIHAALVKPYSPIFESNTFSLKLKQFF